MILKIEDVFDHFIDEYISAADNGESLRIEYDSEWPSDCYQQKGEEGEWVNWLPVRNTNAPSLSELEDALELKIDPQLHTFYTRYWSDNLNAKAPRGELQLLQAWNARDLERLQQNLVGHVLMKRRLNQAETLFFAVTDEEDFIISVLCETGQVVLEQVGLPPKEVLAESLAEFLSSLEPLKD